MSDRRPTTIAAGIALLVVIAAAALVAGPVLAHGNHVVAGPQVSTDGTVVVESLFVLEGGYVAIHADDGGQPGEVIGHRRVAAGGHAGLTVQMDSGAWADWSDGDTAWVVLHEANGDGTFDPADDPAIQTPTGVAGDQFPIAKGDTRAVVVPGGVDTPALVRNATLTLDRVALPTDGHLVIRSTGGQSQVLGSTSLDAGDYRNVSVVLNESYVERQQYAYGVVATLHADDGDGQFQSGRDSAIEVGGTPVRSFFTAETVAGNGTGPQNGTTTTDGPAINTPTGAVTSVETVAPPGESGGSRTDGLLVAGVGAVLTVLGVVLAVVLRRRDR